MRSTPQWPTSSEWKPYTHPRLGFTVEVPAECTVQESGDDVLFRYRGHPILCVNYVTPAAGMGRGLWADHDPSGEVALGGRPGRMYAYRHCDGPMCMNVVSYVIHYGERELGVEFRMRGTELGDVQRHVLDSFVLSD